MLGWVEHEVAARVLDRVDGDKFALLRKPEYGIQTAAQGNHHTRLEFGQHLLEKFLDCRSAYLYDGPAVESLKVSYLALVALERVLPHQARLDFTSTPL